MGSTSERIDLTVSGGWAVVRRTNGADIMFLEAEQHKRGFEAPGTDVVLLAERVVSDWEANGHQSIRDLPEADLVAIFSYAKGIDSPNPSAPSSAGTRRKARIVEEPPQNG